MEKTWKPTVIAILDIVAGAVGLISVLSLIMVILVTSGTLGIPGMEAIPDFVTGILWTITIPLAIVAILAVVGGIYALQRRKWALVLVGSIAAIFASAPLLGGLAVGITATILTALSKKEFE